ncbi:unnamed protein product [Rodentolepis nana]|uniref:EGF-like domain-containing protein n=1 Tax=Rodentolepis nana TaxID=102285 RepID=A0A0R3U0H7_RODNA|nr:unnamed protein product [Rodentolepis nana]
MRGSGVIEGGLDHDRKYVVVDMMSGDVIVRSSSIIEKRRRTEVCGESSDEDVQVADTETGCLWLEFSTGKDLYTLRCSLIWNGMRLHLTRKCEGLRVGTYCRTCFVRFNQGYCDSKGDPVCYPGYYGDECQWERECYNVTCASFASCGRVDKHYACVCDGVSGKRCEEGFDPCAEHVCLHGGTCVPIGEHMNFAKCVNCRGRRGGLHCEEKLNACEYEESQLGHPPCTNGGHCVVSPFNETQFTCLSKLNDDNDEYEYDSIFEQLKCSSTKEVPEIAEEEDNYEPINSTYDGALKSGEAICAVSNEYDEDAEDDGHLDMTLKRPLPSAAPPPAPPPDGDDYEFLCENGPSYKFSSSYLTPLTVITDWMNQLSNEAEMQVSQHEVSLTQEGSIGNSFLKNPRSTLPPRNKPFGASFCINGISATHKNYEDCTHFLGGA